MAEAEQEENVGRPGTDAFDRHQRLMGVLGVEVAEAPKIEAAFSDRLGERPQGANFGVRQSAGAQVVVGRTGDLSRLERRDARLQSAEDGGGAGDRHLLGDDDRRKAGEARFSAAKRRPPAGCGQAVDQFRVFVPQPLGGFVQGRLIGDQEVLDDRLLPPGRARRVARAAGLCMALRRHGR